MDSNTPYIKKKEGFLGQKMFVLPPKVKKTVTKNSLVSDLYLTAIGFYPKATHHDRERKYGSQQYILLYCIDGSGTVELEGKSYRLVPHTYFIIRKGVAHHYQSSQNDPWSIYWLHFTGSRADILYSRYAENKDPIVCNIPYKEDRLKLFDLIFYLSEYNFSSKSLELINIKMMEFLTSFIYDNQVLSSFEKEDNVANSINFMKNNIEKYLTISELASQSTYSISHYSEIFKNKTGLSPIAYFNQLKIQRSCQYLYFTDLNIKEISLKLGFEDPYYFSRLFKKHMGISPVKYKNAYRK